MKTHSIDSQLPMSSYQRILQADLDSKELEMLFSHNKIISFSKNDMILVQGGYAEGIYVVLEGNVIISARLLGAGTTNLEILGPGNFIGEISYIEKVACATSVIANELVKCLFIDNLYFEMLSAYFPETKYKLYNLISKQVCDRLKKMHDKITHLISNTDMITRSFFSEIMQSITKQTSVISQEDTHFDFKKLNQTTSFNLFNDDEIEELVKNGIFLSAPKNFTLIGSDENICCCYIVLHGAVQSSVLYTNKLAKLSVIGPATLFVGIACIDPNSTFTITFTTCEPAILFKLQADNLNQIKKNNLRLWYKLFDLMLKSLVALEKSVDKLDIRLNIETYNR